VQSPDEALALLAREAFDVVVTDMRMPRMDGAELLTRVKAEYPRVARIVLSGQTEQKNTMRSVAAAHRFLAKPCDPETLMRAIEGVSALRELLHNEELLAAVTGLGKLPSLPDSYLALSREVRAQSATAQTVARIIAADPAMSAKVLQLVNSAFFGLTKEVSDVERAVTLLGIETINSLLVSRAAFDSFDVPGGIDLKALWREALLVGRVARAIADSEDAPVATRHAAYEAGLMHDIGKLVLATVAAPSAAEIERLVTAGELRAYEAEHRVLGCDHGVLGAYLLDLWGLPTPIIHAVAHHHRPAQGGGGAFSALVAVHAANAVLGDVCPAVVVDPPQLDEQWLAGLGLTEHVVTWRERAVAIAEELDT
jgi:HD-like signal output (HDOD) protein